ncbi:MAG: DEAD/DEAH box helicase [Gemmatimonadaceae bacterium]
MTERPGRRQAAAKSARRGRRPPRTPDALEPFHPVVREWFRATLGEPSEPQRRGWPAIAGGDHALILAPTGTGKTLAAFLWELNALISEGLEAPLANAIHLLYISPLKALNNDVHRNLERPLVQLRERFERAGHAFPEIRVAVRTGDTPPSARARMLRKTPHILITTPESLHIMLTSLRGRGMFSALRAVVVDEIHAVAGSKRGAHLALTLERLERLCERPPQRIGLSATQRPLEEIGRFLGGVSREVGGRSETDGLRPPTSHLPPASPASRPVTIIDCGLVKAMETRVVSPVEDLGQVGGTVWTSVAPLVLRHIRESRTTLVFVNNRAQAERIAARVNALAGQEIALPYHGSLSRERRHGLENSLKAGALRALVSTSSLELGIDIGSVDLVLQLQSPKRVANGLQRVGRAGHTLQAVSRGVFVPTFRDDALEILAIVGGMRDGDVEPTRVVQNALDVLAQVIVAAVAVDDDWTSAELFDVVRRAYPYHSLTRTAFDEVLAMLSGKYPSDVAAELEARVTWDRMTDRLTASRGSRIVAVTSGGTIPDRGLYTVTLPDRTRLGELDEEFVYETRVGDVFQLGSSTWRVSSIEHDRVVVTPAPGAPARMPFWHGEFMARSAHLAPRVGALRRELAAAATLDAARAIADRYGSDESTVTALVEYAHQQRASTQAVPDDRTLVAEHFRDETGSVRIVLHAPFGARVTAPWGMALAQRAREWLAARGAVGGPRSEARKKAALAPRTSDLGPAFEVQVQTTDDGIMLRLPDLDAPVPLEILRGLTYPEAERRVLDEVGSSSLFGARFRMNAARALLLPRGNPRRRMPLWLQRLKSLDLLQAVREFPSFPILVETYRDVLQDAFDMPALAAVLSGLKEGRITIRVAETEVPSPFAASLQFGFVMDWMYADDAPRAEQRAALLSLDRALLDELMGAEGADEETLRVLEALLARRRGTAPGRRARDADELAVLLDRAGDLTLPELRDRVATGDEGRHGDPVAELLDAGRAIGIDVPRRGPTGRASPERRIILTETYARYAAALGVDALARVAAGVELEPRAAHDVVPEPYRAPVLAPGAARRELVARYVTLSGPVSVDDVQARYDFDADWIGRRLDEWARAGKLVRGHFGGERGVARYCSRRLLEEARRRELAQARRQVRPVEQHAFAYFLQRWQHVDPATRLDATEGTVAAVRQLYGAARPADAWERDYFPARVRGHDPDALSRLCAIGEMVWVGAGPVDDTTGAPRLTSLRFVRRGVARAWLPTASDTPLGVAAGRVRDALAQHGASFFADLQGATNLGTYALRDALRELVAAGVATNDTVEALHDVVRWRPVGSARGQAPDPTRWLPADFVPRRPVVQRRPNLRRLPKWRRPDKEGGERTWSGRWSLVRTPGTLGPEADVDVLAEEVARQWLDRYGIVARDWWRRERPAVAWRDIYHVLKRLEFRGEVRRGYFVRGLAGAQFARPDAVEELRAATGAADGAEAPVVVIAASDPANPYNLPPAPGVATDALTRPRGRGALLVTRGGRVLLAVEGRGRSVRVRPGLPDDELTAAAAALAEHLTHGAPRRRQRDLVIERIDGDVATSSPHVEAFTRAGFRRTARELRFYVRLA